MTANVASNFSDACQYFHIGGGCIGTWTELKAFTRVLVVASVVQGCGAGVVHEPHEDMQALARAVARKDAKAVHGMLDRESRRNVTVDEVAVFLARDGNELSQRTQRLAQARSEIQARAVLRAGQNVELSARDGAFFVESPDLNGGAALTPLEAVVALRSALQAQSYPALLQVLTPELREQVEQHRKRLIEALQYEEALHLTQDGDRLVIDTADGHRVILERKMGVWRVHDFN